ALETGKIAPPDFYEQLRAQTGLALSNQTIEQAWNAMLGKFRPASIASVAPLRGRYRVYLLSNTNQIHYNCFLQAYQQQIGGNPFNGLFDTAYYSHHMGLRKPDAEAYQHILDTEGLLAAETLFIDDTPKNIAGAKAVGLQTGWLQPGMQLEDSLPLWL
ncbi:MAG TPA: HAD family phosphatase, partial [Phnomibacter sp.]|nr:HAD family phosphatase [Phnomibacter sp.]